MFENGRKKVSLRKIEEDKESVEKIGKRRKHVL
jgi:hypothetical protein